MSFWPPSFWPPSFWPPELWLQVAAACAGLFLLVIFVRSFLPEQARIYGIPEPKGYPVVGHLWHIGKSPALAYYKWSKDLDEEVIQIRLGTKRMVVVNSFDAAMKLVFGNISANCDRPQNHTFSKVVSAEGLTVGTTPFGTSYKRKRRTLGAFLSRASISERLGYLDKESTACNQQIPTHTSVEPHTMFNAYSFNVSMCFAFGRRFIDRKFVDKVLTIERDITRFRGHFASNLADYFPILQFFRATPKQAEHCREERELYLKDLIDTPKEKQDPKCIVAHVKAGKTKLTSFDELKSMCLTMSSAGLDTIPSILALFIGHMSTDYGQEIQRRAHDAIMAAIPENPYEGILQNDSIPYIRALVKETLRFNCMPLSLPRQTVKPMEYKNTKGRKLTIPTGTTLLLNIFAANFDDKYFSAPFNFNPDRYLDSHAPNGPPHFAFGAGSRMCAGANLAEREIYVAIARIILSFHILPPANVEDRMPTNPYDIYAKQSALMIDLPHFKVNFVPRDWTGSGFKSPGAK